MPNHQPFVTIAIPCLNEAMHIERCLRDALGQDYPSDRLEVIAVDGGSTDGTRAILERVTREEPRARWLPNPRRIQAHGLNVAFRAARGDVLVRFDAHAEYAPDYVAQCVAVLERTGAANVGGAQRAKAHSPFQHSLCAALESPLGVGGAAYRSPFKEGYVDTVFCGAFRREILERVGLYDPNAITNEDAELNQRILRAGARIYLSRSIVAHYHPRGTLRELARQYFRYGTGRARTLLKHGQFANGRPFVPFVGLVGAAGVVLFTPKLISCMAFGGYLALTGMEAYRVTRRNKEACMLSAWAIFPTLHFAHGAGMAAGLVRYTLRRDWGRPEYLKSRPPTQAWCSDPPTEGAEVSSGLPERETQQGYRTQLA